MLREKKRKPQNISRNRAENTDHLKYFLINWIFNVINVKKIERKGYT